MLSHHLTEDNNIINVLASLEGKANQGGGWWRCAVASEGNKIGLRDGGIGRRSAAKKGATAPNHYYLICLFFRMRQRAMKS